MPTEIKQEGSAMRKLIMEKAAIKNNLAVIKEKAGRLLRVITDKNKIKKTNALEVFLRRFFYI